jgi:hypothetical protein
VIKPENAHDLLKRTRAKNLTKKKAMEEIQNINWDCSWVDKALQERGCEYID